VTSPISAVIGEGRESEAVLPLSRLDSMLSSPDMGAPSPSLDVEASIDVSNNNETEIVNQLETQVGDKIDNLRSDMQDLASEIKKLDVGEVKVTADGKVLAEIDSNGKDKYRKSMEVNK
jgi:hypothetical protein